MKIPHYLTRLLYFAIVSLTVFAAACKDDKEPEPDPVDNNPIVGTWQLKEITPETPGTTIPELALIPTVAPCIYNLKLTFNSNNTVATSDCPEAILFIGAYVPMGADAKWQVTGDKLTLTNKTTTRELKISQTQTDLNVVVNLNTDTTKPPVNVVLKLKRV